MECVKLKIGVIIALCVFTVIKCDATTEHPMSSSGSHKTRCATEPNASKKVEKVIKECETELKIKLIKDTFLILKEEEEKQKPHHYEQHDHHDHHQSYQHYHHHDEEEEHPVIERKKINYHVVHEPKPIYNHDYHYNHHDEYTKPYVAQHKHRQTAPLSYDHYEAKNKYWPYPDEPSPMFGVKEINKRYWSHRSKRSPQHDVDNEEVENEDGDNWKYNYELDENSHSVTILPEDRWIAGCLIHCVLEKNNATDKHGWPTLDGLVAFYTDGVHEHEFFLQTLRFVNYCLKGASHRHGIHRYMVPQKGQDCELSFDVFDCVTDKITEYCAHK